MYEQFSAVRFRKFESIDIDGLQRVNLITGPNSSGKTSLLEALFVFCGANPLLAVNINQLRGMEGVFFGPQSPQPAVVMRSLFHDMDSGHEVRLSGREADRKSVSVAIDVPETSSLALKPEDVATTGAAAETALAVYTFRMTTTVGDEQPSVSTLTISPQGFMGQPGLVRQNATFLQPRTETVAQDLAARFGKLVVAKKEQRLVDALQIIEPELTGIATVMQGPQAALYANIGRDELVPLWLLGGGNNHLAHIVSAILEFRGSVVLIDEIENGVYYDVLPAMWRVIDQAAREADCQVFATTHSRECVVAAHDAFSERMDYGLSVHRLEPEGGQVRVITYGQEALAASIEANFEVR